MSLVPKHIKKLKPYIAGKSKDEFRRKYGNINPIKLASNENSLGCSPKSIERVQKYLEACNRYPDSSGYKLREKLAKKYDLSINNVIIGSGSEGIMSNIMRTFLHGNDKIISSRNSFIGFRVLADASGYESAWAPMNKYHYDLDAIARMIDSQTKIIYLANPDNPTGTFFNRDQFDKFMQKVPDRILIILDEAYYEYAKDSHDYPDSMLYRYDNIITLRTFSKAHGLAGFRVGYGFAHEELIKNLLKVKLPFEPSILAQEAAIAALDDEDFIQNSIRINTNQKMIYINFLNKIILITLIVKQILLQLYLMMKTNHTICEHLLKEGVIVRNLIGFGLPNCMRVTIGLEEENHIFKQAFLKVIKRLYNRRIMRNFKYLEFYVGNAKQAAHFYCSAFGFSGYAYSGPETGDKECVSYVLKQNNIFFVFTTALSSNHRISKWVEKHGDGVSDIAFSTDSVEQDFKFCEIL